MMIFGKWTMAGELARGAAERLTGWTGSGLTGQEAGRSRGAVLRALDAVALDALYQGTTLVVPLSSKKIWALAPESVVDGWTLFCGRCSMGGS